MKTENKITELNLATYAVRGAVFLTTLGLLHSFLLKPKVVPWTYSFTPATIEKKIWLPPGATLVNPPGPLAIKSLTLGDKVVEVSGRAAFEAILPKASRVEVFVTAAFGDASYKADVNHVAKVGDATYKLWERVYPDTAGCRPSDGYFVRDGLAPTVSENAIVWHNEQYGAFSLGLFVTLCYLLAAAASAGLAWLTAYLVQEIGFALGMLSGPPIARG